MQQGAISNFLRRSETSFYPTVLILSRRGANLNWEGWPQDTQQALKIRRRKRNDLNIFEASIAAQDLCQVRNLL